MEDTIPCANYNWNSPGPCQFWFVGPNYGSPDYFTNMFSNSSSCSLFNGVPQNIFGYQNAHTYNSFLGFAFYTAPSGGNREWIAGTLNDSLISGHKYCVEFYVSSANNCKYVTDDIAAYFSNDTIYGGLIGLNTQVENFQGNILNDTMNWMQISGEFIAQGGEKFITIGNFKNDGNTTLDSLPGAQFQNFGYYYIDDVSVIDCTVGIEETKNNEINFTLLPNPAKGKLKIEVQSPQHRVQRIEIINTLGEKVFLKDYFSLKNKEIEINVGALSIGLYFLKLVTDKGYGVGKFVKE